MSTNGGWGGQLAFDVVSERRSGRLCWSSCAARQGRQTPPSALCHTIEVRGAQSPITRVWTLWNVMKRGLAGDNVGLS